MNELIMQELFPDPTSDPTLLELRDAVARTLDAGIEWTLATPEEERFARISRKIHGQAVEPCPLDALFDNIAAYYEHLSSV